MIRAVVLLGAETVELYGRTGKIPENNFEESGGYVTVREFETKAEYDAYVAGMEDHDGHEDWRMIAVQDSRIRPFMKVTWSGLPMRPWKLSALPVGARLLNTVGK